MTDPVSPRAFDEFADEYDRLLHDPLRDRFAAGSDYFIEQKCRVLLRHLQPGSGAAAPPRLLDAGCGQGTAIAFLRKAFRVVGSDVSLPMLHDAVRRGPVTVQEPFALPFAADTFDAAYAFCVYHHIGAVDHARHLRELARVVAPGGRVFVFEHNPYNPVTRTIFNRAPIDQGCRMIRPAELRRLFRAVGLADVSCGYLLFVPESLSRVFGRLEPALSWLPLGGQYFVAGRKAESASR
jgi:SAM-dependent methyltransferase